MVPGLCMLLAFQLAGEALSRAAGVNVPGAAAGMALLFVALLIRGETPEPLETASAGLQRHIGLLFVPAGAGIGVYAELIAREWFFALAAGAAATLASLAVCAAVFTAAGRPKGVSSFPQEEDVA